MTGQDMIPIGTFFASPSFSRAQISPDGAHVAYLSPWHGRTNIFVCNAAHAGRPERRASQVTSNDHRNIEGFQWSPDSAFILFVQDANGDENWHLYRASAVGDTPHTIDLTPFPGVRVMGFAFDRTEPARIFLQMNARDPAFTDLYSLDLVSGELTTLAKNPGRFVDWLPIPGAAPHAIILDTARDPVLARYEGGDFVAVTTFSGEDHPLTPLPRVPTPDGKGLWIGSNRGTDRTRLVLVDLANGSESEVDSHPVHDLDTPRPEADPRFPSSLILNPATGALLGAAILASVR